MNEFQNIINELKQVVDKSRSPWFTVKEACQYIKRSETFIRENIKSGKIRVGRFGSDTGDYRIHRKHLDLFVFYGTNRTNTYQEKIIRKLNQ
ncbi:MAG: helix-turn-helix domain-containing protein [Candidatus Marinimicrobia bacterium]|nr:helix-turn-helix domain-containing protein [Candidatus Neomarinimicrobiota bacterium]